MWIQYLNLTNVLFFETAFNILLDQIALEIDSHAVCIIANNDGNLFDINNLHLTNAPTFRSNCYNGDENNNPSFVSQVQKGVNNGCSFFVVSSDCALHFLENFHDIHDWVMPKYEKKVLVIVDSFRNLSKQAIMTILQHRIVINDLPLTLLLQPNLNNDDVVMKNKKITEEMKFIDMWSAYPYSSSDQLYNKYFINNSSFLYEKKLVPKITDLNGIPVTGAFIHYPPYTSYSHVPPGTGNANLFGSNDTHSVQLGGQEHIILIELCIKYNCTVVARLDYDEALWGESFHNHTGIGLIGALTMRDANVSCAALYSWDTTYEFTQYSAVIQRATVTHIVPKPKPLPYWQTPMLPFPGYIWGYVTSAFMIGAIILFVVNLLQLKIINNKESYMNYSLFESIFAVFMMSIFQGISINIKFLSNIILFTVLLIYALIIGNLYVGGLASVMTVTRYEEPIDSVEKLVKTDLLWGATAIDFLFAIQRSDYIPYKSYGEKFIVLPIPEMHKLVKQQKMAVMLETMQDRTLCYQPYLDKDDSKFLMMTKHSVYWQNTIIMTSKTWPFMEQLNRIVLMQQESGIRYYWEKKAATSLMDYDIQRNIEENGKPPGDSDPVKLSIDHIRGALFLLLFGTITATVFFILELLWYHFDKTKNLTFVRILAQKWKQYKKN